VVEDDLAGNGEPEARAPGGYVACRVRSVEALEDVWLIFRGDTDATINDLNACPAVTSTDMHVKPTTCGAIIASVRN
jgi:hypothetical protein